MMFYIFLLTTLFVPFCFCAPKQTTVKEIKSILQSEQIERNYYDTIKALNLDSSNEYLDDIKKQAIAQLNILRDPSTVGSSIEALSRAAAYQQALLQTIDLIQRSKGLAETTQNHGITARKALEQLTPSPQERSLGTFVNNHKGKLGMGAYQVADSLMQQHETGKLRGLKEQTPTEIMDSFSGNNIPLDQNTSLGGIAKAVRPLTKASFSLLPWAYEMRNNKWLMQHLDIQAPHELKKEHVLGKGVGALNFAGLLADQIHSATSKKNRSLTKKEAYLLSYLNRRHGVAQDIKDAIKRMKRLSRIRTYVQILGQWGLPAILAMAPGTKRTMENDQKLSTAMMAGNIAGLTDSLMSIAQRNIRTNLIKKIKAVAPFIEEELIHNPPTQAEKEADKEARLGNAEEMGDLESAMGKGTFGGM